MFSCACVCRESFEETSEGKLSEPQKKDSLTLLFFCKQITLIDNASERNLNIVVETYASMHIWNS